MLCYVMTRILGTGGDAKGRRSPGVYCTFLGRLGGIKPARRTDCCLEQARNGGTARDRNAERAEGNSQLAVTASPLKCVSRAPVWNRWAPRAGRLCIRSSESVDGSDGHSLAGAWQ